MTRRSGGLADVLETGLDVERMIAHTVELVGIPSFPGEERDIAHAYGERLAEAGLEVELDERYEGSPTVVARLAGTEPGPVLQLAGHLDTVPVAQGEVGVADGRVYGRGSCDMKGGLAAIAEVATTLARSGGPRRGALLITAYGRHEGGPPGTMHEPLRDLLRRGVHGDLALVADGPNHHLPVVGKGSIIFEVHLRRPGEPFHELRAAPDTPNPVLAAHRYVSLLLERTAARTLDDPDVGGETVFIGAIRGGDLYNRIAIEARIDGTRRYPAPRTYDEARAELEAVAAEVAAEHGLSVEVVAHRSGQPFRIDRDDPFVSAFQAAVAHVTGGPLPLVGSLSASDVNHISEVAGIPAILHGTDHTRAHATPEWASLADLERITRIIARTVGGVLDTSPGATS